MIIKRYYNKCMAMLTLRNWVLGALLLTMLVPYSVSACDSMEQRLSVYWNDGTAAGKAVVLQHLLCLPPLNYQPKKLDPMVLKVVVDAIAAGVDDDLIRTALQRYRCAYSARRHPDYQPIIEFIGKDHYADFCRVSQLERWFLVNTDGGAVLRAEPSIRSQRLASIPQGHAVEVLALFGDWVRVAVVSPYAITATQPTAERQQGYVYAALLQAY